MVRGEGRLSTTAPVGLRRADHSRSRRRPTGGRPPRPARRMLPPGVGSVAMTTSGVMTAARAGAGARPAADTRRARPDAIPSRTSTATPRRRPGELAPRTPAPRGRRWTERDDLARGDRNPARPARRPGLEPLEPLFAGDFPGRARDYPRRLRCPAMQRPSREADPKPPPPSDAAADRRAGRLARPARTPCRSSPVQTPCRGLRPAHARSRASRPGDAGRAATASSGSSRRAGWARSTRSRTRRLGEPGRAQDDPARDRERRRRPSSASSARSHLARQVTHPNVCRIYDLGVAPAARRSAPEDAAS